LLGPRGSCNEHRVKWKAGWQSSCLVGLVFVACGGDAFKANEEAGATGGASGEALGGQSGSVAAAGQLSGGAPPAQAGTDGADAAGSAGLADAGAAGAVNSAGGCEALGGVAFGAHCYVDISIEGTTATQASAVKSCRAFGTSAQRASHVLVLDSRNEESFVLETFMAGLENVSDAWLGLTCDEELRPDVTSCYCSDCKSSELETKREAWTWLDGSSTTFGWIGANPDNGFRCAALGFNPLIAMWGWADRNCSNATFTLTDYPTHTYRTICELE